METQIKAIARNWYLELIIGVLFIAVGVWAFMTPATSYVALSIFFAITFLLTGLMKTSIAFSTRKDVEGWGWSFAGGIVDVLIGVLLVSTPYREKSISDYLAKEIGELTELDKTFITSVTNNNTLTDKIKGDEKQILTKGQRIADKLASFGGSWTIIISFGVFILIWIFINMFWLVNKGFDPYPFILLNLILSCSAGLQGPIIMAHRRSFNMKVSLGFHADRPISINEFHFRDIISVR